jgi:hypothetical protein
VCLSVISKCKYVLHTYVCCIPLIKYSQRGDRARWDEPSLVEAGGQGVPTLNHKCRLPTGTRRWLSRLSCSRSSREVCRRRLRGLAGMPSDISLYEASQRPHNNTVRRNNLTCTVRSSNRASRPLDYPPIKVTVATARTFSMVFLEFP